MEFKNNPGCQETHASLCLYGDFLNPVQITAALKIEPRDAAKKGDPRRNIKYAPYRSGLWIFDSHQAICSQDVSTDLEKHIHWILDQIKDIKPKELPGVEAAGLSCFWTSRFGHGGPIFRPETMLRVAETGLEIWLDIYTGGEDDN